MLRKKATAIDFLKMKKNVGQDLAFGANELEKFLVDVFVGEMREFHRNAPM
ncbi:MAG: hypothetical protein V4760_15250 [Bdellovibrionota bacterium]